jgi:hypothetical protein
VIGSGLLPRWLGWVSVLAGILFFLQGFTLGGGLAPRELLQPVARMATGVATDPLVLFSNRKFSAVPAGGESKGAG